MNAQPELLNEELERIRGTTPAARQEDLPPAGDPEVRRLAALARAWQSAPPLQVDSDFANQLNRRLRARQSALARSRWAQRERGAFLPRPLRARPILASVLSLSLAVILLSAGILVAAAQVTNPTNPLYALKRWEQQSQAALSGSPADQAEGDLQAARDQMNALPDLANAAHAGQYRQALADFDQQFGKAAQAVAALPAGQDHTRLVGELATLQTDARRTLRGLLLQLAVPERQTTTDELGQLGDTVPGLREVDVTLPAHPNGQASISISGVDLQVGAVLLVDGKLVTASGSLQDGRYLFTTDWKGEQHPHSIGIMNPDGTVAQTTAIALHTASDNGGNGGGNGGGTGNGGAKPQSPTAPHR